MLHTENQSCDRYLLYCWKRDIVIVIIFLQLEVEFGYTGACYVTPTASPAHCQLDPYDMVELSR